MTTYMTQDVCSAKHTNLTLMFTGIFLFLTSIATVVGYTCRQMVCVGHQVDSIETHVEVQEVKMSEMAAKIADIHARLTEKQPAVVRETRSTFLASEHN
jgi:hypothetical protein